MPRERIVYYLPTGKSMHARVKTSEGVLDVWKDPACSGEKLGQLKNGDIITVNIYTGGCSKMVGEEGYLIGGFVRTEYLVEIPDEKCFPEGDAYKAEIQCEDGYVSLWEYCSMDLDGSDPIGTLNVGDIVIAQDYDCGYSSEVVTASGLRGFVATKYLVFIEPAEMP